MKKYLALFLISSSLFLIGCGEQPKEEEKPIAVSVQNAKKQDLKNTNNFIGKVSNKEETSVTVEMPGVIQEVYVNLGQKVSKGDNLLTIKGDDVENSIKQAQAALELAKANYQNSTDASIENQKNSLENSFKLAQIAYDEAKRSYDINLKLFEGQAISEDILKKSEMALNQAKQNLDMAQKSQDTSNDKTIPQLKELAEKQLNQAQSSYDIANSNLNKLTLVSPADGIITEKNFNDGELASQQKPAFVISNTDLLQIDLEVTEKDLTHFKLGQEVDAFIGEKTVKGKVSYIPTVPEKNSSLYKIQIDIQNLNEEFKSGMSANIELSLEKQSNVISVPKKAVFEEEGKKYIYSVGADNLAVKKEVTTGIETANRIEIKSGISDEDTLIIGGIRLISDGSKVFPVVKED